MALHKKKTKKNVIEEDTLLFKIQIKRTYLPFVHNHFRKIRSILFYIYMYNNCLFHTDICTQV
jgi:hypothetical protein